MDRPWWRSRRKWWAEEVIRRYGLTEHELNMLAGYNAERHRGIAHTEAWQAAMAELQRRFDEASRRRRREKQGESS